MFKFKQFAIEQDRTAMKVGTDGVLIGAWVAIGESLQKVLDIGSGTGLIALMMAQRCKNAVVDAVEIDGASAEQAAENIAKSEWSERVNIHCVDIANFNQQFKYDLIISNPPFFCDSLHSPNQSRTNARHTTTLPFEILVSSVERLLSVNGRFALILPVAEAERFCKVCENRLFLVRRCLVASHQGGESKRVMMEFSFGGESPIAEETIAIREANSNEYSVEYKTLTSDFYLKF